MPQSNAGVRLIVTIDRATGGCARARAAGVAAVALTAWLVMACPLESRHGVVDPDAYADFDKCLSPLALEVANDASERVGVTVRLREPYILL